MYSIILHFSITSGNDIFRTVCLCQKTIYVIRNSRRSMNYILLWLFLHMCFKWYQRFIAAIVKTCSLEYHHQLPCLFTHRVQVSKLIRLTDNAYTYEQVIKMELVVLRVLNFRLSRPTPIVFLDRFLASHKHNDRVSARNAMVAVVCFSRQLPPNSCYCQQITRLLITTVCIVNRRTATHCGIRYL